MAQLWFKFWAKDYLADGKVACLSFEQRGILLTLWAYAWEEGSIPSSPEDLAALLRDDASAMRSHCEWLAAFFVPHPSAPSRWVSPRLELERAEADRRGSLARESAKKRWDSHLERMRSHSDGIATALPSQCDLDAGQGQGIGKEIPPIVPPRGDAKPRSPRGRSYGLVMSAMDPETREEFLRAWNGYPTQGWNFETKAWADRRRNQEGTAKRYVEILAHNQIPTPHGPRLTARDLTDLTLFFVASRKRTAERKSEHLNVPSIENFYSAVDGVKANPWQNAASAWLASLLQQEVAHVG